MSFVPRAVLVVDDDPDVRETFVEVLSEAGHHPVGVENGKLALEYLRTTPTPPDLILLDLMMPVMDGFEFCALHRRDPRASTVPIVILTADNGREPRSAAVEDIVSVRKPIDLDLLLNTVDRYARKPSA